MAEREEKNIVQCPSAASLNQTLGSVSAFKGDVDFPATETCRRSCRICITRVNGILIAGMQGEVTYTFLESNELQWSTQLGGVHSIVSECIEWRSADF